MEWDINPTFLLLGTPHNNLDALWFGEKEELMHVVSRCDVPGGITGTPLMVLKSIWYNVPDDEERMEEGKPRRPSSTVQTYQLLPSIPMSQGYISNGLHKGDLAPANLPSIKREHDFYRVECYDFTWVEQILKDMKTRAAITFVSEGLKARSDFGKNLALTVNEFKRPIGYGMHNNCGKSYLSKDDEVLNVVSFLDPRYVAPIFRTDQVEGMFMHYRLISRNYARRNHLISFCNMAVFLSNNPDKTLGVDGESIEKSYDYYIKETIVENIREYSEYPISVKGNDNEKPKKRKEEGLYNEYNTKAYSGVWSTSTSTSTSNY